MATNQRQIGAAWKKGEPRIEGAVSTDGTVVRSYHKVIGCTLRKGDETKRIVFDWRGPNNGISVTTSRHVSGAAMFADAVIPPTRGSLDVFLNDGWIVVGDVGASVREDLR